jgi:hypothetical protein
MAQPTKMDDLKLVSILDYAIGQSVGFAESRLSKERTLVQEYYDGERPKRAHHGDSDYVSLDVYDSVESMRAQLLEVFSANNRPVSFSPSSGEDVESARIRTDYVTSVLFTQNRGYHVLSQTIQNGLMNRAAVVKVYWDSLNKTEYFHLSQPTMEEFQAHLAANPKAEVTKLELHENGETIEKVTLKLPKDVSQVRVEALDGEDFGISPMAKDIETAELVFHRHEMTVSDLIKHGYDPKIVKTLQNDDKLWQTMNTETIARFAETDDSFGSRVNADDGQDSRRVCLVFECYMEFDLEDSGTSQLYKVTKVGNTILDKEPVDRKPFVAFTPLPRPGAFWGHNYAKFLIATQKARTYLTRSIINSALITNNPRMMVVKGGLDNPRELMENRFGGIVNVKHADAVIPLPQASLNPFVFQTIQMLDSDKEQITGISQLSQGLNKDAISKQNSEGMVQELITVSQIRQKIVARNLAEHFLRGLYSEIYRLVVENEDRQKIISVAGAWVPVDFTQWPETTEMEVSFALGYGEQQKEVAMWAGIHASLANIPALAGSYSPAQQYYVVRKGLEASGRKDIDSILLPPDKAQPPPPNPLQQAEIAMKQADAQVKQANAQAVVAKLKLDTQAAEQQHQLEMAKINLETLKIHSEIQLKQDALAHKIAVDAAQLMLEKQIAESDTTKETAQAIIKTT